VSRSPSDVSPFSFNSLAFEAALFSILTESNTARFASRDRAAVRQAQQPNSHSQWVALLSHSLRAAGFEFQAWQSSSELLCRCLINTETLGKALSLAERMPTTIGQLRSTVTNSGETLLILDSDSPSGLSSVQLASYLKFFSWLIDEPIYVSQVQFKKAATYALSSAIQAAFNCELKFESDETGIAFEHALLDRPVVRTYKDLRFILALPTLALIPWSPVSSIGGRVTQLIAKAISRHDQAPTLDEVSFQLGRSSSSLRRQLHHEGTSFQTIKDTWRKEQAEKLLMNPENTVEFIASRLGFECSSAFSRAFKLWTGISPSQFRQALQLRLVNRGTTPVL
jgi:AraC-like DNA-binding protein